MDESQDGPRIASFAETASLYAVMNSDQAEAVRLIEAMLPGERHAFAEQVYALFELVTLPSLRQAVLATSNE